MRTDELTQKAYERVSVEVLYFSTTDIVCTSGGINSNTDDGEADFF